MEVAIMGAGMSGLCCAITLERYGITPTIFEKRSRVGDRFINAEAKLKLILIQLTNTESYVKILSV